MISTENQDTSYPEAALDLSIGNRQFREEQLHHHHLTSPTKDDLVHVTSLNFGSYHQLDHP